MRFGGTCNYTLDSMDHTGLKTYFGLLCNQVVIRSLQAFFSGHALRAVTGSLPARNARLQSLKQHFEARTAHA